MHLISAKVSFIGGNIHNSDLSESSAYSYSLSEGSDTLIHFSFGLVYNSPDNLESPDDYIEMEILGYILDISESKPSNPVIVSSWTIAFDVVSPVSSAIAYVREPSLKPIVTLLGDNSEIGYDAGDLVKCELFVFILPGETGVNAYDATIQGTFSPGVQVVESAGGSVTGSTHTTVYN